MTDAAPDAAEEEDPQQPLSAILRELMADPAPLLTVSEVVQRFGRRAFGAVLFVFSVPNLLPLPPGSSTVLGAPLLIVSPQVLIGVHSPWLPRAVAERQVDRRVLQRAFARLLPALERVERLSRPRLGFMFGSVGDRLIGLICTVLAVVLVLPIPLGNMLPAAAVAALSLGLVQRDGVLALLGYGLTVASVAVLTVSYGVVIAALRQLLALLGG